MPNLSPQSPWNFRYSQDWEPTAQHDDGESQGDSQESDSGNLVDDPQQEHEPGNPADPTEHVEFELNQIMEDMETALPKIPLPPVDQPQTLAKLPDHLRQKKAEEPVAQRNPVPTPCRADTTSAPTNVTNAPLRSLKAHEDCIVQKNHQKMKN